MGILKEKWQLKPAGKKVKCQKIFSRQISRSCSLWRNYCKYCNYPTKIHVFQVKLPPKLVTANEMGLHECGLPEDMLPPCWNDDVRMNALFAPFRLKTANPESWKMKMDFWSELIRQWCRAKGDSVVSAADAKVAFHRKGRTPACIDIVVEEMYRSGELVPITKYQQILHSGPEGWVMWGARLAFKPAAIALTAVTSLMPGRQAVDSDGLPKASIESTQRFVLESVLKDQANSLLTNYPSHLERVGTVEELMKRSEWQHGREAFELVLGWLLATGAATIKGDVVKLAEPSKKVSEVTKSDEALVNLCQAEARLEADATRLTREMENAHRDAQAQYAIGNKPAAKNHLRRRHRAEQRLKKCEAALDNVKHLLQNLRDTDSNKAIVDTYKTTSEAMKETGLNEDAVHDTMDDLKEVMDTYNEVEKALSNNIEDVDTAELEAELQELLATPSSPGNTGRRGTQTEEKIAPTPSKPRRNTDREFVFDGEERILAELAELGIEDSSPPTKLNNNNNNKRVPVAVGDDDGWKTLGKDKSPKRSQKQAEPSSQAWYPPSTDCLRSDAWNNNLELRQDERLHPGQPLNLEFRTPPHLYNTDFLVQDHTAASRVWLYNARDSGALSHSIEYSSGESPGKVGGNFQMAPGGEREGQATGAAKPTWKNEDDATAELERRLHNLRGFNL